jgi:hypothetical protein
VPQGLPVDPPRISAPEPRLAPQARRAAAGAGAGAPGGKQAPGSAAKKAKRRAAGGKGFQMSAALQPAAA